MLSLSASEFWTAWVVYFKSYEAIPAVLIIRHRIYHFLTEMDFYYNLIRKGLIHPASRWSLLHRSRSFRQCNCFNTKSSLRNHAGSIYRVTSITWPLFRPLARFNFFRYWHNRMNWLSLIYLWVLAFQAGEFVFDTTLL